MSAGEVPLAGALRRSGGDLALVRHPSSRRSRRRLAVAALVLAVVAALVVTDLPTSSTVAYRRATWRGYLAILQGDVASCSYGVRDALQASLASLAHSSDIAPGVAATFTTQGIDACSFTNSSEVDLAQMQPPQGISSPSVEALAPALSQWVFPAAFRTLHDLSGVLANPSDPATRRLLSADLAGLDARRRRIDGLVVSAEHGLGAADRPLVLTSARRVLGAHGLPVATSAR